MSFFGIFQRERIYKVQFSLVSVKKSRCGSGRRFLESADSFKILNSPVLALMLGCPGLYLAFKAFFVLLVTFSLSLSFFFSFNFFKEKVFE